MGRRSPLFTAVSGISLGLLLAGAVLAVPGIFNSCLNWYTFSPDSQQMYFAGLWSILTLSAFSVSITLVVGIREAVRLFGPPAATKPGRPAKKRDSPFGIYLKSMGIL